MLFFRTPNSKSFNERFNKRESTFIGVTIGNFDGLHLGHQEVFAQLFHQLDKNKPAKHEPFSVCMSFSPKPKIALSGVSREVANILSLIHI